MAEWFENLVNKDYLQDNLTFASLFIALYENMTDYVVSSVRDFLCDIGIRDGKMFCEETDEYRREIWKRVVDDKGNRDTTKASFLWLIDHGAITSADFDRFLQIKQVRNKYAHKLSEVITTGIAESEVALLFDMHSLYRKISGWFLSKLKRQSSAMMCHQMLMLAISKVAPMLCLVLCWMCFTTGNRRNTSP